MAHNGSVVPVPGRDIFAQAWYQGGVSLVDFTDSANPVEIAYFDRGPIHEEHMILGGYWSTYWYNGKIYGTEIARGLDVFALVPSEYLSENEVAAALLGNQGELFNPQQQFPVTWPAEPVVAKAYIDQLLRSDALTATTLASLYAVLEDSETRLEDGRRDRDLSFRLQTLAADLEVGGGDANTMKRRAALSDTLNGIARKLR